jgi:hypothetical protein
MSESDTFSTDDERGLTALLDTLIPESEDGRLPGAGQLGLARALAEQEPDLRPLISQAVGALDAIAAEGGAACFAELPAQERGELVAAYASEGAPLIPALVFHTYTRYYQERRVVEALGLEHRPPYPEGFPMEPTDGSLFDAVRQRGTLYREVPERK